MEENINRIILGIDISTTCLGVSLAKYNGKEMEILKVSHVKPKISKPQEVKPVQYYQTQPISNNKPAVEEETKEENSEEQKPENKQYSPKVQEMLEQYNGRIIE